MPNTSLKDIAITLTEPVPKQFGNLDGEPAYDEFSKMMERLPARALPTLEGALRAAGYTNVQSINPYHHGINGNYSSGNYRRMFGSDAVGIGTITRTTKQGLQLVRRIKQASSKTKVVLGGPHFTMNPNEGLESKADVVIIGEGEKAFPEILATGFDYDKLREVKGIAFTDEKGEFVTTLQRHLLNLEEYNVQPYYDDVTKKKISIGVVEGSRGCLYHCDHCQSHIINREKFRARSVEHINEQRKRANWLARTVFHVDDFIAGNKKRLIEYSYAIKEAGLNKGFGIAQITAKALRDPETQQALLRMGIKMVCIGYEHVDDIRLAEIGKPCDAEDNIEAARICRYLKLWNHAMTLIDLNATRESIRNTVEWANKHTDSAQFFHTGNLAKTEFDLQVRREKRVIVDGIDSYSLGDGHHVLIRGNNLSPYEQQVLGDNCYYEFYSFKNNLKRLARLKNPDKWLSFGIMFYTNFLRGISRVVRGREHIAHLEFLKSFG